MQSKLLTILPFYPILFIEQLKLKRTPVRPNFVPFIPLSYLVESQIPYIKGWLVGCRLKANSPLVGPGPLGGVPSVGVFLRGPKPVFTRVSEKTTENSERLGRQARPGLNLAPPVFQFSVLALRHWWG